MSEELEYKSKITKEEIAELPTKRFPGEIHLIDKRIEWNGTFNVLKNSPVLGFDTETKPNFRKGRLNKVSLLQLSTGDEAFLFRLHKVGIPKDIIDIFENEKIIKVGAAIKDDLKDLLKVSRFKPRGFVDLQHFVQKFNIQNLGLKKMTAIILNFQISKNQQLSNWESPILTTNQQYYASTDAWVCYEMYNKLSQEHKADFFEFGNRKVNRT